MSAATLLAAMEQAWPDVHVRSGWDTRGGGWMQGFPVAQMVHHTAPPVPFPVDNLAGISDGRIKCNVNVKPDGAIWMIAYRACNYSSGSGSSVVLAEARAGTPPTKNASDRGLPDDMALNAWYWNLEVDHPGDGSPMPAIQSQALTAALTVAGEYWGLTWGNTISHAESTARKGDPFWDGDRRIIDTIRASVKEPDDMPLSDDDLAKIAAIVDARISQATDVGPDADGRQRSEFGHSVARNDVTGYTTDSTGATLRRIEAKVDDLTVAALPDHQHKGTATGGVK